VRHPIKLRMNLLENAYDSINESLRKTIEAESNPGAWKFALLTIVQAIELLLKERLYREHRLLVYENVDKPTRTVTLGLAFERLNKLGVGLARSEVANVKRAMDLRNDIQHYEFEMVVSEARNHYSRLFEFATAFHHHHLGGELHTQIHPSLWDREAELIEVFKREFVPYQGQSVIREWPARIRAAQTITRVTLADGTYERLTYGEEPSLLAHDPTFAKYPCHDCAVVAGQYHVPDCDLEECPRCGGQLITCDCEILEPDADDLGD
jgi:hypothetical protein